MIKIRNIDYLVLRVLDPDSMLHFYREVLGCSVEPPCDESGQIRLRLGSSLIQLAPIPESYSGLAGHKPSMRSLNHLCLSVEAFDETRLRTYLEAHSVAAGPLEYRHDAAEGLRPSITLRDPEGNPVELRGPPLSPFAFAAMYERADEAARESVEF